MQVARNGLRYMGPAHLQQAVPLHTVSLPPESHIIISREQEECSSSSTFRMALLRAAKEQLVAPRTAPLLQSGLRLLARSFAAQAEPVEEDEGAYVVTGMADQHVAAGATTAFGMVSAVYFDVDQAPRGVRRDDRLWHGHFPSILLLLLLFCSLLPISAASLADLTRLIMCLLLQAPLR